MEKQKIKKNERKKIRGKWQKDQEKKKKGKKEIKGKKERKNKNKIGKNNNKRGRIIKDEKRKNTIKGEGLGITNTQSHRRKELDKNTKRTSRK